MNRVVLVTILSARCVQRVPSQILEQILVQLLVFHVLLAFIPQVLLLNRVQHAALGISLRSSSKCHASRAHLDNGKTWKVNPHATNVWPEKFQNEPNKQAMRHAKIVVSIRTCIDERLMLYMYVYMYMYSHERKYG